MKLIDFLNVNKCGSVLIVDESDNDKSYCDFDVYDYFVDKPKDGYILFCLNRSVTSICLSDHIMYVYVC